jgi:hypothetical protein
MQSWHIPSRINGTDGQLRDCYVGRMKIEAALSTRVYLGAAVARRQKTEASSGIKGVD